MSAKEALPKKDHQPFENYKEVRYTADELGRYWLNLAFGQHYAHVHTVEPCHRKSSDALFLTCVNSEPLCGDVNVIMNLK